MRFDVRACNGCNACVNVCRHEVLRPGRRHINLVRVKDCDGCLACVRVCKQSALTSR
jgi:NAD-dependent dihydropyrimidine dehydrogenase PreA subunit